MYFHTFSPEVQESYCTRSIDSFKKMYDLMNILNVVVIFSYIGYLTAVIQKITVVRLKDNVQLSIGHILLEIVTVAVSVLFIVMNAQNPSNALVST